MRSARAFGAALAAVCLGCAPTPSESDAAVDDAFVLVPLDVGDGLPQIDDLCRVGDGDAILGLVANETLACTSGADAPGPLFPTLPTLPSEYHALHTLCSHMNPAASTRDDLVDPALAIELHDWIASQLSHPALVRALSGGPTDPEAQIAALQAAWLGQNGFEHVFCGELDPTGSGVWGLHMWSEWALAESEGRANYQCTTAALDRHDVVTMRYQWTPEGRTTPANKPVGSFQVGMSPACMLALGYVAMQRHVQATAGASASFHARIYDEEIGFSFVPMDGAIVTMFATEQ